MFLYFKISFLYTLCNISIDIFLVLLPVHVLFLNEHIYRLLNLRYFGFKPEINIFVYKIALITHFTSVFWYQYIHLEFTTCPVPIWIEKTFFKAYLKIIRFVEKDENYTFVYLKYIYLFSEKHAQFFKFFNQWLFWIDQKPVLDVNIFDFWYSNDLQKSIKTYLNAKKPHNMTQILNLNPIPRCLRSNLFHVGGGSFFPPL